MPLARQEKFAPSQTPYAIDPDSGTEDGGKVTFEAVWAGRKHGETTVSVGTLWDYDVPSDVEGFLAGIDMRYGGRPRARWDGHSLWTDADVDEAERAVLLRRCQELLDALPEVPEGHLGWFYRTP